MKPWERYPTSDAAAEVAPTQAAPQDGPWAKFQASQEQAEQRAAGMGKSLQQSRQLRRGEQLQEQYPFLSPEQAQQFADDQAPESGRTLGDLVTGLFTGKGRALPGLEEISADDALPTMSQDNLAVSLGEMATIDPQAMQGIWGKQLTDAGVEHAWGADPEGNPILSYQDPDSGKRVVGYINRPGASAKDLPFIGGALLTALGTKGLFGMVAPKGLQAKVASSGLVRAPVVGGGAATGSAAMDLGANQVGAGTEPSQILENAGISFALGTAASPIADMVKGGAKWVGSKIKQVKSGSESAQVGAVRSLVTEGSPREVQDMLKGADADFWKTLHAEGAGKDLTPEQWRDHAIMMAIEKEIPGFKPLKAFVSGDPSDFAELDRAIRKGNYGPEVQNRFAEVMRRNQEAVEQRSRDFVRSPEEGGAIIREGLQERSAASKEGVQDLYQQAYESPGQFDAQAVRELPGALSGRLEKEGFKMAGEELPEEMKTARQLLSIFGKAADTGTPASTVVPAKAGITSTAKEIPGQASDIPLERLEQARRYAGQLAQAADNNADRAASRQVMRAYDEWFDDALNRELYKGDPKSVEALKRAREAHRERRSTYGQSDRWSESGRKIKDQAGKVIADIIEQDLNPVSVVDNIIGRSQLGMNKSSEAILGRLEKAVGRKSPEWAALQESALHRVFYDPRGRLKSTGEILKAWDGMRKGDAKRWAVRLFGRDQFDDVNRFVSVLGRTVPKTNVYVPSASVSELRGQGLLTRAAKLAVKSKLPVVADVAEQMAAKAADRRITRAGESAVEYMMPDPVFIPAANLRRSLIATGRAGAQGSDGSVPGSQQGDAGSDNP